MTNGFQPKVAIITQPPNRGTGVMSEMSVRIPSDHSYNSWIDVKNALPPEKEKVLFVCKNGDCFVGEYRTYGSHGCWVVRGTKGREMHGRVAVYWMSIPELPDEVNL